MGSVWNDHILLVCARHVPRVVHHFFALGEKLVQEVHAVGVLVEELGFPRLRLAFLDKIQDHNRRAVSRKQVIKVPRSGGEKWVDDTDWVLVRGAWVGVGGEYALSMGGLGVMLFCSCIQ